MTRQLCAGFCLALVTVAIPLRAANRPHAGTGRQSKVVWTNDDLDKLHDLGMISIIGREDDERPASAPPPAPYLRTKDPEWYAEQAARLRDELEYGSRSFVNTSRRLTTLEISGSQPAE